MKFSLKSDSSITILDYVSVFMIIVSTGTAYFYLYHAGVTLLALLTVSFLYTLRKGFRIKNNLFYFVYSFLIPLNYILYSYNMSLVGDAIFLLSTYLILASSNYNTFRRAFLDITVWLSIISIFLEILYIGGVITPTLYGDSVGSGLLGHYFFAFHAFGDGLWGLSTRLYGVFWEPGIYQMVINICLLMNLDLLDKTAKVPLRKTKLLIIAVTLIMTRSTTGFLAFLVIIVGYFFMFSTKSLAKNLMLWFMIIIFSIGVITSSVVVDKFSEDNGSFIARFNDWIALYNVILERPLLGAGVKSEFYRQLAIKYGMTGAQSAGIMLQTAEFGVLWLFAFYYSLNKEFYKRKILLPVIFYMIAITILGIGEPLCFSPLILMLVLPFKKYAYE